MPTYHKLSLNLRGSAVTDSVEQNGGVLRMVEIAIYSGRCVRVVVGLERRKYQEPLKNKEKWGRRTLEAREKKEFVCVRKERVCLRAFV